MKGPMRDAVIDGIERLRRRCRWVRGADVFLEVWFVASLAAASLLLLDRLAFEFGLASPHVRAWPPVAAAFGVAFLSAVTGGIVAMSRRIATSAVAWQVDKVTGGEERLLTTVELAGNGAASLFAPALFQQAAAEVGRVEGRRVYPSPAVGYRSGVLLAMITGGFLVAYPPVVAPPPVADFSIDFRRGAAPLDVVVEDASIGVIDTREWDFGDGQIASGRVVAHRYSQSGRYTVTLTVRGPGGTDVAAKRNLVEVLDARSPVADFSADPVRGRSPLKVRFTNRSSNAAAFEWDFGDGRRSTAPEPDHVYESAGVYTVTLTATNDFGRDVVAKRNFIKVVDADAPLAEFRANPRKGAARLEVQFDDLSEGRVTEWLWDFGDPNVPSENTSRERNGFHSYGFPGKYTVRLRVKGPGGEDEMVKEHYIEVEGDGEGGGGKGSGNSSAEKDPAKGTKPPDPKGAGDTPGRNPFDKKTERPKTDLVPVGVDAPFKDKPLFEKDKQVMGGTENGGGTGETKYDDAYRRYQRAAEDAMEREQIPPSLRDYVKQYFEAIRPK